MSGEYKMLILCYLNIQKNTADLVTQILIFPFLLENVFNQSKILILSTTFQVNIVRHPLFLCNNHQDRIPSFQNKKKTTPLDNFIPSIVIVNPVSIRN